MATHGSLISLLAGAGALALLGCGSSDGPGDDGSTGDGTDGDSAPAFTSGVSTLSGRAEAGYVDGERGAAKFANPVNVAYGPDGLLYVADFDNHKIRMVDPETGETMTALTQQGFKKPFGLLFAPDGALYVSTDDDSMGRHSSMTGTIWRVDLDAGTASVIAEEIGRPRGMAMLPDGRLAISDYMHHVISTVDLSTGVVSPLAGTWDGAGMVDATGTAAQFSTPYGMAYVDGKLVVADYDNSRLREVALDGTVTTVAGSAGAGFADGAMGSAKFSKPQGVVADAAGNLYVTDLDNYRVRKVAGGSVETIAGNGSAGYADSDDRLAAQLYGLEGLGVTPDGTQVFVADGGRGEAVPYNRIRRVDLN